MEKRAPARGKTAAPARRPSPSTACRPSNAAAPPKKAKEKPDNTVAKLKAKLANGQRLTPDELERLEHAAVDRWNEILKEDEEESVRARQLATERARESVLCSGARRRRRRRAPTETTKPSSISPFPRSQKQKSAETSTSPRAITTRR